MKADSSKIVIRNGKGNVALTARDGDLSSRAQRRKRKREGKPTVEEARVEWIKRYFM